MVWGVKWCCANWRLENARCRGLGSLEQPSDSNNQLEPIDWTVKKEIVIYRNKTKSFFSSLAQTHSDTLCLCFEISPSNRSETTKCQQWAKVKLFYCRPPQVQKMLGRLLQEAQRVSDFVWTPPNTLEKRRFRVLCWRNNFAKRFLMFGGQIWRGHPEIERFYTTGRGAG